MYRCGRHYASSTPRLRTCPRSVGARQQSLASKGSGCLGFVGLALVLSCLAWSLGCRSRVREGRNRSINPLADIFTKRVKHCLGLCVQCIYRIYCCVRCGISWLCQNDRTSCSFCTCCTPRCALIEGIEKCRKDGRTNLVCAAPCRKQRTWLIV